MRKVLESQGYPLVEAEASVVGPALIRHLHPSLILLDIGLPGIGGESLLRLVKADVTLCHIPVIAVTAAALPGDRERFLAAGFEAYLSNPVHPLDLLATVRAFDHHADHQGGGVSPGEQGA